jgi:hypothetical protein
MMSATRSIGEAIAQGEIGITDLANNHVLIEAAKLEIDTDTPILDLLDTDEGRAALDNRVKNRMLRDFLQTA